MPARLIAEVDDIGVKLHADEGPSRELAAGGARVTQILYSEGLAARGARELEMVGVQAAATRPAIELLASIARVVVDGMSLSAGEVLNLGITTVAVVEGSSERLRVVDHDWAGSGRPVAESAVRLLALICEDLGFAALREQAPDEARGYFEAAAELDPKSVTALMGVAFSWRDEGDPAKAEGIFTQALEVGEAGGLDSGRRALIHFERARCAREQGGGDHAARALKDFGEARKLDPDNPEIAYEHAHALFVAGDDKAAQAALAAVKTKLPSIDAVALEDGARIASHPPDLRTIPGHPEAN